MRLMYSFYPSANPASGQTGGTSKLPNLGKFSQYKGSRCHLESFGSAGKQQRRSISLSYSADLNGGSERESYRKSRAAR
ncbi:hypothetical protein H2248_000110 [Termitomyces sp. 'cryptogamus']|nr:hypothetical protein H2248_000110 [Termitomyces sp. 'cryptogamus']